MAAPLVIPNPYTRYTAGDRLELLGGLNNALSDEFIEPNELSSVSNYGPDPENAGVLTKREGITRVSTQQAEAFTSIHDGIHDIWATTTTKVINDGGTDQSLSLTSTADPDWTTFRPQNMDIVCNGSEIKDYTGSWAALGGSPPTFKYIESYQNFIFGSGHSRGIIRWSALGNAESWPATNAWELLGLARGVIHHGDSIWFFTDLGWHQLRGTDEQGISITFEGTPGTTSHRSLVSTPFGLFYWSDEGIMWTQTGSVVENLSRLRIPKTFDSLNHAQFATVHGVYNMARQRVEFYAHKAGSSTQDIRIDYYPRIGVRDIQGVSVGSFWINEEAGVDMAASGHVLVSGVPKVYVGSAATSGYLYDQTGETDDGTVITAHLETDRGSTEHGSEAIKRNKMLVPGFLLNGNSTIKFSVYQDNETNTTDSWNISLQGSTGFLLDTSSLDVDTLATDVFAPTEARIPWKEKFRKLKFRIEDSAAVRTKISRILNRGHIVST